MPRTKCDHDIEYTIIAESEDDYKKIDRWILITKPFNMQAHCTVCDKDIKADDVFCTFGIMGTFDLDIQFKRSKFRGDLLKEKKKRQPLKYSYMGD